MEKKQLKKSENKENKLLARIHNRNKSSQKIFLKFMPKLSDLIYKSNIVRGNVIFDEV